MYSEDEMLMLSGIQHYMFCPRQWALIHISQQWEDNKLTAEGHIIHNNVDNPLYRQKNGGIVTLRSLQISSRTLGLYGITDAVELTPSNEAQNAIRHPRYAGYWRPNIIEYKRGHSKPDDRDRVQLAAQTICIEEMFGLDIPSASLFYHETRHREIVQITEELRETTRYCASQMHILFSSGTIPKAEKKGHCANCSLKDICLPELTSCGSVKSYLKENLYESPA